MKKLLLLALLALPFTVSAQTTTNAVDYRIQVVTVTGGVTNTVNTSWRYDLGGSKKDQNALAGLQFAYGVYTSGLATNAVPLAFGLWLKEKHTALITDYEQQKQAVDNATRLEKLRLLLTQRSDLLVNADFNKLDEVIAKAP